VPAFTILPRRWVVERTIAWSGRYRRLSKAYEDRLESSETSIYLAMTRLMLRRLAQQAPSGVPSPQRQGLRGGWHGLSKQPLCRRGAVGHDDARASGFGKASGLLPGLPNERVRFTLPRSAPG
jgi:hypothetical protein